MIQLIKKYWEFILAGFLWLCIWATYNTDIFRFFNPGFPHSAFDLIHAIRSIFPFFALAIAIIVLVKNKKFNKSLFKGPLGLLLIYSIIGIVASIFSKNPVGSLYWGILYLTAIIVLLAIAIGPDSSKKISFIIRVNWIIASFIALGLILAFLFAPGIFSSLTITQFLHGLRPYEGIGNINVETNLLGMAGTRPTGLGRYAGLAAIVMFANLWRPKKKLKVIFSLLFVVFFLILIFSRARTSVAFFFISALIIIFSRIKSKGRFAIALGVIMILLSFTNFYQYSFSYLRGENLLQSDETARTELINEAFFTLSGRTSGVWQDAWHLFLKNPLVGFGFQADRIFLNGQHAHNSLLQAMIQSGVLGTIFFVLTFLYSWIILIRLFKKFPQNIVLVEALGVLAFFTLRGVTESSAFFGADYLFLVPVFACLQFFPEGKKNCQQMSFCQNKIDLINISDVINKIKYWIKNESQKLHWIIVTGMHGVVESEKHADFKYILSFADLWVPDGISLVWLARIKGLNIKKRISGMDLMHEFLELSSKEGFSNYFYGDTEEILRALNKKLSESFSSLKIAGSYSPPFRELTEKEDQEIIERINQAKPDVLWVALGLPKQEKWIFEHRDKLNVPVVIGVGAAFKFVSGKVKRAPTWVGNIGFEWLWRLFKEPKVTWKRVFFDMPFFIWLVLLELVGFESYKEVDNNI